MSKKAIYRHKRSGDFFAIETDENGKVLSTSGPLLTKDFNTEELGNFKIPLPSLKEQREIVTKVKAIIDKV